MSAIFFLFRGQLYLLTGSILTGLGAGFATTWIMILIHRNLQNLGSLDTGDMVLFALVVGLTTLAAVIARFLATRLTEHSILLLRRQLARSVMDAPLETLERVGSARLFATLADDVNTLKSLAQDVPNLCVQVAVIIGCVGYLGWLSVGMVLMALVVSLVCVLIYKFLGDRGQHHFSLALRQRDVLFDHFRALTGGIKEMKLNARRRRDFLEKDFDPTTVTYKDRSITGALHFIVADSFGQVLFFALLGSIIFWVSRSGIASNEAVVGFVLVFLFMSRSIEALVGWLPLFARGELSLANIREIGLTLGNGEADISPENLLAQPPLAFATLELADITYSYRMVMGNDHYSLGPINMHLKAGEILFVTGGNGSGKTTTAKLLCGLYTPLSGTLKVNGEPIDPAGRFRYRQLFSTVFSDFYLFRRIPGATPEQLALAQKWLRHLAIDTKVTLDQDFFSTVEELSQGQRKRLALVIAYLEDRPIYLFDEWAADQDPEFRRFFYHQILPELKERGKAVVAITHDDAFFHLADRIMALDAGKLKKNNCA